MKAGKLFLIIFILLLYGILLFLDLSANLVLGWIPWMGNVLETMTETIFEVMQGILVLILAALGLSEK